MKFNVTPPGVGAFGAELGELAVDWTTAAGCRVADGHRSVARLPAEAEKLGDLTSRERAVLPLVMEGLGSREIAQRLQVSESLVYLTIADLLRALEYVPPSSGADDIHRRAGTRPATSAEIERFHEQFGPFASDDEG